MERERETQLIVYILISFYFVFNKFFSPCTWLKSSLREQGIISPVRQLINRLPEDTFSNTFLSYENYRTQLTIQNSLWSFLDQTVYCLKRTKDYVTYPPIKTYILVITFHKPFLLTIAEKTAWTAITLKLKRWIVVWNLLCCYQFVWKKAMGLFTS